MVKFGNFVDKYNLLTAIIVGLGIPLSTGLENIALGLVVVCVLISSSLRVSLSGVVKNKFVITSLLLYALFVLGCFWTSAPTADLKHMLGKMLILVIVPFAIVFFKDSKNRKYAMSAYFVGIFLTVLISYLSWAFNYPVLHGKQWNDPWHSNTWCPFRAHAYHCYFIGIAAVILLGRLLRQEVRSKQIVYLYLVSILLISFNILYMVASRTGQIAYIIMIVITLVFWKLKKGLIVSIIFSCVILPMVVVTSPVIQSKINQARVDLVNSAKGDNQDNSLGLRKTFHKYAGLLIMEKPIFGHGTGSYASSYSNIAANDQINQDGNPHSDYLWFGVELGYCGMLLLCALFFNFAYCAWSLNAKYRSFGFLVPLTYAIICTQNSFLTDSVSGIAFVFFAGFILSSKRDEVVKSQFLEV